ncbi:sentrin-specific protease 1-like [Odontomachus brunneus]|uniref:sentrin-specific protease 1-like n=1 Tax=Odontomachus brunneus TaxID=486640 RepID=UPI0013F18987|nr:sentrin-specific protease 1-like [Odontomachus brunneus]XP_032691168.1 sentrin-specific protease 1-like [Odontomachus brunneus]XP_032691169.1 sentrin-specific protease 1-like [Odontomachus brunneus]XP_032691170.1 sentrin-specific protease 1-like [Odontomachus brunneus]
MIFDFLKKIFGWADEGSRKRKASESCSFERRHVIPKKLKTDCSMPHWMDEYSDIDEDDDIIFLSEHKFLPRNSCTKMNGTHKKAAQSYQFHAVSSNPVYKPVCSSSSLHRDNSTMSPCFASQKHKMQDISGKCHTLVRTNQLKERYQYEELLQNFLPSRIQILKDKCVEHTPVQNVIEVVELDDNVEDPPAEKTRQITARTAGEMASRWRKSILNNTRADKGRASTSDHREKNDEIASARTYQQSNKTASRSESADASRLKSISSPPVKPVATNSLRDELAAKAVMRQDFIPEVAKRYNERIEQRYREAEELKRMTCVLSKHNRYAREAALEEQLARSMKLCMAVLDEREEPDEPPLPKLTDEMQREIKNALVPCPQGEVLVDGFGLRITRKDIHTLVGLNWLNDEVINFYMNLLITRGTTGKYPKVHAMNTFFYPKLLSGGHSSLKRWTRKVDVFAQDLIVVPVHLDIHWCMSIIDFREKSILYYDSMGGSNPKCLAALKQYLQDESLDKKKKTYDMSDWKLQSVKDIPQQMNGSDCGVFSCMFAEYVCANKKITFTQQDMPYFRNKMVYEILKSKLL